MADEGVKKQIENKLQEYRDKYYNGQSIIPDEVYDALEKDAKEKYNIDVQTVGHPIGDPTGHAISDKIQKVPLPYYMGSLRKIKTPEELKRWLKDYGNGGIIISDKLDGISCMIEFHGKKTKLYTRGDGREGSDISKFYPYLALPKIKEKITIRGELLIQKKTFESKYSQKFNNQRNMVSGLFMTKTAPDLETLKDISFVGYSIFHNSTVTSKEETLSPKQQLEKIAELKLETPYHLFIDTIDSYEQLEEMLTNRKNESEYEIDGLVLTENKYYPLLQDENPKHSIAFKSQSTMQTATTTVKDILWKESKYGYLKPTALLEEVILNGVSIKKVTAYNAKYVMDNKLGKGSLILITRSGDVIPKIIDVITKCEDVIIPDPNKYIWNETKVDLVLKDDIKQESDEVIISRITSFFSYLGVKGLANKTITNIYNELKKKNTDTSSTIGLNDFLILDEDCLLKVKLIGKKKAKMIVDIMDTLMQNGIALDALMIASGCFGHGMGEKRIQSIVSHFPKTINCILKHPENQTKKEKLIDKIKEIEGFSDITAKQFVDNLEVFRDFYEKIEENIKIIKETKNIKEEGKLTSVNVLFSSIRDKELEKLIVEEGGHIRSGISKKVTHLIVPDKEAGTTKVIKAKQYGIKIMTIEEFKETFNL